MRSRKVDITPTWREALRVLLIVIANAKNDADAAYAFQELERMADLADKYVKLKTRTRKRMKSRKV